MSYRAWNLSFSKTCDLLPSTFASGLPCVNLDFTWAKVSLRLIFLGLLASDLPHIFRSVLLFSSEETRSAEAFSSFLGHRIDGSHPHAGTCWAISFLGQRKRVSTVLWCSFSTRLEIFNDDVL